LGFYATLALIFILIFRPQEIWPVLETLHILDVATAAAALGTFVEFFQGRGRLKHLYSPQLPYAAGLVFLCYFCTGLAVGREGFEIATRRALLAWIFMLVVMYGARTVRRFIAVLVLLVGLALFIGGVAIHQGYQDPQCIELPENEVVEEGEPDGRECINTSSCYAGGRNDRDYACERMGLFNTVSTMRRVRWRGQLDDPNELSVFLAGMMPLILGLSSLVQKKAFTAGAVAAIGLWIYTVVLTMSRGGQLAVGSVLGVYFLSRFRWKGLVAAALFVVPLILYGGRETADAAGSSEERTQILYDGIALALRHPLFGVGAEQFPEYMSVRATAHNSYLLAAAEMGFGGIFFFSGLLWSSLKIGLSIMRRKERPELQPLAMALCVSFVGIGVGIFFLSFTYKQLLWIWFGLAGALYGIVKEDDPKFEVTTGWKDYVGLTIFGLTLLAAIYVYTRLVG
jgi:hypothetical protein